MVAVGEEIDLVANPHREDVLRLVVGDVLHLLGCGIIHPDVVRHTTLVVFPRTELTHHTVIGKLFAIRRIATEATLRQRNRLRESTLFIDRVETAIESGADTVTIDNGLPIRCPSHHDIVRTHTVAQVVTAIGGGVGHPQRLSTGSGNCINLRVPIILPSESDRLSIRRETGEHLIPHERR